MIGHVLIRKNPWREIRITGLWRCSVWYCNPGPVVGGDTAGEIRKTCVRTRHNRVGIRLSQDVASVGVSATAVIAVDLGKDTEGMIEPVSSLPLTFLLPLYTSGFSTTTFTFQQLESSAL